MRIKKRQKELHNTKVYHSTNGDLLIDPNSQILWPERRDRPWVAATPHPPAQCAECQKILDKWDRGANGVIGDPIPPSPDILTLLANIARRMDTLVQQMTALLVLTQNTNHCVFQQTPEEVKQSDENL